MKPKTIKHAEKELSRALTDLGEWHQQSLAGQSTSPRKAAAARKNGKLGGRPRTKKGVRK